METKRDAERWRLMRQLVANGGCKAVPCGAGVMLYLYDSRDPREPRLVEGGDLDEVLDRVDRERWWT